MRRLVLRYRVAVFVVLTIGLSFAAYLLPMPVEAKALAFPIVVAFVPTATATALAAIGEGRAGLGTLYGRLRPGRPVWLLIALLAGVGIQLAIAVLSLLLGYVPVIALSTSPALIALAVLAPIFALGEEIGWRGFALPELLLSRGPLPASLLIGLPWALVHVSLFLPGMMYVGRPPVAQLASVVLLSVILTWVFVGSGGSVLAPALLHGVLNSLGAAINSELTAEQAAYLSCAVLAVAAIVLVVARPSLWLRSSPEVATGGDVIPGIPS